MAAQAAMPATEVAATGAAKGGKRPPQSWLLLQLSAPPAPPCSRAAPAVLLSASGWVSGLLHNILSHIVTTNTREAHRMTVCTGTGGPSQRALTYNGLKGGAVAHKVCEWVMTPFP